MPPDLTISIISADNLALLLPCLRSVFASTHCVALEVFVVDNASRDDTASNVISRFPQVTVIRNAQRLGFSTNNNLVLGKGEGRYLMLLNDDTMVLDGALDILVEFMDSNRQVGAAGSFLLNPDRSVQAAFARFPNPVLEAIYAESNRSLRTFGSQDSPFETDSVCGAAMIVRREVLDCVGPLDLAFDPIYSEEVDWCYRIKRAGWRIYALPQSQVIHYGSVTMNRIIPRKYELLLSHKLLFFRKHKGPLAAAAYRLALGISTAVKVLWWSGCAFREQYCAERRDLHLYLLKRIWKL